MATKYERLDKDKAGTKKTVFTHYFDENGLQDVSATPDDYDRVVYLGGFGCDGDTFAVYRGNVIEIMYGVLGDEFK